jgi:thioredoxin reductase
MPSGAEIYDAYLRPLAATPEMSAVVETGARVTTVTRHGIDKVTSRGRAERPFALAIETASGATRRELARAVIDASGTWTNPNPLGGNGLPAEGETEYATQVAYGIPDVLGRLRRFYAGRRILVVGAGHSAANALLDLVKLAGEAPDTEISWAVRGKLERVYGGGDADQLAARAELGAEVKRIVDSGRVQLIQNFSTALVRDGSGELRLTGDTPSGTKQIGPFDRIIVATGQRPDLSLTRELRLELDPWLESVRALGPLIDPNEHSCGSVPPHGHRELSHPEPGFYTVGIKSYGRAPTFLLITGYEQVRSVAAAIAGDMAAADDVQLVLPETGVCVTPSPAEGCCGGPAPNGVEACCAADAEAKAVGETGCGCGPATATKASPASCCGA